MSVTGHTSSGSRAGPSQWPQKAASIRDVAQASGVSYQTVSRVINGHPNVKEETRKRVQAAIEALGFRRNATAFAQGGAQHPNGDALTVKPQYDRTGGGDVYIYMQDQYAQWPYENLGLSDYLAKVDTMVSTVAARSDADDFVWVPFNEPDGNWYTGLGSSNSTTYANTLASFKSDWTAVYNKIRSIIPDARIAGPNEAKWDARFMGDFYPWAKTNNLLPDITTWHELDPSSLSGFESHLAAYRTIETNAGISKLPVNIDEYADRRDQSVPGQMIQWMSMFERNKVYADQAYWNIAGNLNDNNAQTNIPNGTWWLLRWYAGLTGQTVKLTPPQANTVDTVQGIASLDTGRKQAQVLLGGTSGSVDTVIQHVPSSFGSNVNITVERTGWSGYEGAAAAPGVISRTTATLASDGSVTVPLTGLDAMSAYRITVNPAGTGSPTAASLPWSASYEAENATITSGTVYSQGSLSNPYGFATSGTKDVGSLNQSTSKVAFTVNVPSTGTYDMNVFYGNQSGAPATQTLTVDGGSARTLSFGPTLNWTYRATASTPVSLTADSHTLTLAKGTGEITLTRSTSPRPPPRTPSTPRPTATSADPPPTTTPPPAPAAPAPWSWAPVPRPPSTSTPRPTATTPSTPTTPPPRAAPSAWTAPPRSPSPPPAEAPPTRL
jgi:hypothetical protein